MVDFLQAHEGEVAREQCFEFVCRTDVRCRFGAHCPISQAEAEDASLRSPDAHQ